MQQALLLQGFLKVLSFQVFNCTNIGLDPKEVRAWRLNREDREKQFILDKPVDTDSQITYSVLMIVASESKFFSLNKTSVFPAELTTEILLCKLSCPFS